MIAARRLGLVAVAWLASSGAPAAEPSTAAATAGAAAALLSRPRTAPDDAAAAFAYRLGGHSRFRNGHRYLTLRKLTAIPKDKNKGPCAGRFACFETWLKVAIGDPAVLAGRTTRLTLIWSPEVDKASEYEVRLAANGSQQFDWLRPAMRAGAGRRLALDVPALAIKRGRALIVHVTVAVPEARDPAQVDHLIDGLELELLP